MAHVMHPHWISRPRRLKTSQNDAKASHDATTSRHPTSKSVSKRRKSLTRRDHKQTPNIKKRLKTTQKRHTTRPHVDFPTSQNISKRLNSTLKRHTRRQSTIIRRLKTSQFDAKASHTTSIHHNKTSQNV